MSNMADTSLAAFKRAHVTAGQQRVIDFMRARPTLKPTRQDIADLSGMKLQSVTPRVLELLQDFDPPWLRELPAVDGKHRLELVEHDAPREVPKKPEPVWVKPVFEHYRISMSVDEAQRYLAMPESRVCPATLAEARAVAQRGRHYVPL